MARWHRQFSFRSRSRPRVRSVGWLAALMLVLPLVLSACGETAAPTASTGAAPAATTGTATMPTAAAPTGAAPTTGAAAPTTGGMAAVMGTRVSGTAAAGANTMAAPPVLQFPATNKRGEGGTLRLLWWQAPTILNIHLAQGTKDYDASRIVVEPLATYTTGAPAPDIPVLAAEIPSAQNGGLPADLKSVTWKLKSGITWSDGMPFTAEDVKFTFDFVNNKANGATTVSNYDAIESVTVVDATTVRVNFKAANPVWFLPFAGGNGSILPKHIVQPCENNAKACPYNLKPTGTGPFVVTDFRPGDSVLYAANEKFREANAPFFARVEMKGGGDPTTAVKAVQTGAADYAWNPTVTPDVFQQFTQAGGVILGVAGASSERIFVNFTDPSVEVDGEKSSLKTKNPFFSDKLVRQAVAIAIDREAMAKNLYGAVGVATNSTIPNVWDGLEWKYDPRAAMMLLEQAGWKLGPDGVRVKDGKRFAITFRTSVSAVRDRESLLIQQNLKAIGIAVELKPVDSSVFFGQPDNPDALARFETDLQMYTNGPNPADVQAFLNNFSPESIMQKSNGWKATQVMRWQNDEYVKVLAELKTTLDPMKRIELSKKLDQIMVEDVAQIPLIAKRYVAVQVKGLEGTYLTNADSDVWNIAHWSIKR